MSTLASAKDGFNHGRTHMFCHIEAIAKATENENVMFVKGTRNLFDTLEGEGMRWHVFLDGNFCTEWRPCDRLNLDQLC